MKIGFIGLGSMGEPMARNLARAGHDLIVYNRTRSRAEDVEREGAQVANSPFEAARDADALITMLSDDRAVEEIVFGGENKTEDSDAGIIYALKEGAAHISMSTISVALSKRLEEAHARNGQFYIAAPVFGRPEAAAAAKLWIIAGGAAEQIEKYRALFDAMGQGTFHVGVEAARANVVKIAGNFMIAAMLESLGEAFALVRKNGIEAKQFLEIINGALFKSPIYQNYGTLIAEERFEPAGFKLKLGLKDVRLALAAADEAETPMPLAALVHQNFLSAAANGKGEIDWAALGQVVAERAGLDRMPDVKN
jgi:3-hydroxyisobutyrate dehydrogenase-like beta-hydroxyacid dehydrogenase